MAASNEPVTVYYDTTTLCPECESLIPGRVQAEPGGIFIARTCPDHGDFKGLICSDREWYERLPHFDVQPDKPPRSVTKTLKGCPQDCGLCPSHRQKAGTAAIEISNRCNAKCPVCLADNQGTFELSPDDVRAMVQNLIDMQGRIDVVTLSGGEPTIHTRLFEILDALEIMPVGRIVINTNGRRIAEDDRFLDALASRKKIYVSLHFDGTQARSIRGIDFAVQEKALDRLCRWGIRSVPLILAIEGCNENELGNLTLDLLTRSKHIKTVILSLMAYTGRGGTTFPSDPSRRLTIPAALDCMEQGSGGNIKKAHFMPLPMPNPLCAAIGYFLVQGDGVTPLIPIAGPDRVTEFLKNAHFGEPDVAFESFFREVIDNIYSDPNAFHDAPRLLSAFRDLLERLFPPGTSLDDNARRDLAEEKIKSVYLMQFMDKWTFDTVRMSKCSCQHLMPDGRIIPSCGYYSYHRRFDERFS